MTSTPTPPTSTSLRRKTRFTLLSLSGAILLLTAICYSLIDWYHLRADFQANLASRAQIVGANSAAPLAAGDLPTVQLALESLRSQPDIAAAVITNLEGRQIAQYPAEISPPAGDASREFRAALIDSGRVVGFVTLYSNRDAWQSLLLERLMLSGLLFATLFGLAFVVAGRLQRNLTQPLLKLVRTTGAIVAEGEFERRVEKPSEDEIGELATDINTMLEQIQQREVDISRHREELERTVEERTRKLTAMTEELRRQAYHDSLTDLANRTTFDESLKLAIYRAERYQSSVAVLFLDLDRFKVINDTLGHAIGDKLLIEVGNSLKKNLRQSDLLARFGGDEFAVLSTDISNDEEATEIAHRLIAALDQTFNLEGFELHISTSIGVSLFPRDGDSAEKLLKNADAAMYRAKELGRNRFQFFSAEMNDKAERRMKLELKLREAIKNEAFEVFYQPIWNLALKQVHGVEALLRWHDPEEGNIAPAEFIPLAEECGLISSVDEWVLRRACHQVSEWLAETGFALNLSVNLSPREFIHNDLKDVVTRVLESSQLPPSQLELDISENLLGPSAKEVVNVLEDVQKLGVRIAIDDFGTAYSSFSRLRRLPLNTLKIDGSFIKDIGSGTDGDAVIKTIISLASFMELNVVAEGVELVNQLSFLEKNGCHLVQGYFFAEPVSAAEMGRLLSEGGLESVFSEQYALLKAI